MLFLKNPAKEETTLPTFLRLHVRATFLVWKQSLFPGNKINVSKIFQGHFASVTSFRTKETERNGALNWEEALCLLQCRFSNKDRTYS